MENESHEARGTQLLVSAGWWGKFTAVMAPIALLFISLGEATDAGFLMRELSTEIYGIFSKQPEYNIIERLHVGNTEEYALALAGMPAVSRVLSGGTTAKYFMRGDYLLTLFIADERISAYTVVTLNENFTPTFDILTAESRELGSFTYADVPIEAAMHQVDMSRITRYYVETFDSGRAGRFLKMYLGNLDFGAGDIPVELAAFYEAEISAPAGETDSARVALRRAGRPNFYGRGELQLEQIIESILTKPEFTTYFPR